LVIPNSIEELKSFIQSKKQFIPVGNLKSYGDCALGDTMLKFSPPKKMHINKKDRVATVSSNVLLGELIQHALPKGMFPIVVPGTKYVTIGGAIAADVHGKNHHLDGCFSDHVLSFNLLTQDGKHIQCDKNKTPDLWKLTCGGMGLTGVITSAKIKLQKVKSPIIEQKTIKADSLSELFNCFIQNNIDPYSVAWIDCTAKGDSLGRGVYMSGRFIDNPTNQTYSIHKSQKFSIPFTFPKFTLNPITTKCFNSLYYYLSKSDDSSREINYDDFFFPLDKIKKWNRLYGDKGFLQYQFVLPTNTSLNGMKLILKEISKSRQGSPLAVLKLFGKQNENYLSFPMEGFTLALDFKNTQKVHHLLNKLDSMVNDLGGRFYLAKESRIKSKLFWQGYTIPREIKTNIINQSLLLSDQRKRLFDYIKP